MVCVTMTRARTKIEQRQLGLFFPCVVGSHWAGSSNNLGNVLSRYSSISFSTASKEGFA